MTSANDEWISAGFIYHTAGNHPASEYLMTPDDHIFSNFSTSALKRQDEHDTDLNERDIIMFRKSRNTEQPFPHTRE